MPDPDREDSPTQSDLSFPRRVRSWLPFLWTRVLFCGRKSCDGPARYGALLLLLLPSALLYPGIAIPLFEPDEGRYAEDAAARRMGCSVS
jgi:hypothetical protein